MSLAITVFEMTLLPHITALAAMSLVACTTQVGGPGGDDFGGADAGERADFSAADAGAPADAQPSFDGPCGEGDASFEDANGVCYEYFFATKDWAGARSACQQLGGDLARIDDLATNGILASLVPTAFPNAWLRGTDALSEGAWNWAGEQMSYQNWRAGEPNNGGGGAAQENCMIIESNKGGSWDDRTCLELNSYLCQRQR